MDRAGARTGVSVTCGFKLHSSFTRSLFRRVFRQFQSMLLWPAASLLSIEVVERNASITGRTWSLGR